jgi:hypothetical protein
MRRSATSWRSLAALIDWTPKKLAGEFFAAFDSGVGGTEVAPAEADAAPKGWLGRPTGAIWFLNIFH